MRLNINSADRMVVCDPEIDASEALKIPGVVKVITHRDIKANGGTNQMAEANLHERSTVTLPSRKILCDDKIFRYEDETSHCETTDRKILDPKTGLFTGHMKIGYMTFWARCRPDWARHKSQKTW